MKSGFVLLILSACLAAASAQASNLNATSNLVDQGIDPAPAPATVLDGIPLMQGLQMAPEGDFIRILPDFGEPRHAVTTVGIADVNDVYDFYQRSLPPMGWQAISGRSYRRGTETLRVDAQAEGKLCTVTFTEKSAP